MALFALIVEHNGFMFRLPTNTLEEPRHGSNCRGVGGWGWSIDITTEQEQGDTTTKGKHNKEVALSLAIVCSYQVPDFQTVKLYFYV